MVKKACRPDKNGYKILLIAEKQYHFNAMQGCINPTAHMKILPALLLRCLLVVLLCSLFACSANVKQANLRRSGAQSAASGDTAASQDEEEVSRVKPEPEEMAEEEIAALNQPGLWEHGADKDQSSSPVATGIDLSAYDFPITINRQVLFYLDLFQGKQRNYFSAWLARSTRYRPFIEKELHKAGLPKDLVFLAMIESGYNPSAYSTADAAGLWQFIEETGRRYGLQVDSYVDERREPEKATKAAIKYLTKLYNDFGDWHLAVAAYNAGEKRIENAINNYNTTDFWEIAASEGIYLETKRYVPKLIAAIIIARNPEKYGFTDVDYQKPHSYDLIDVPAGTDLRAVAATADTSVKQLRALNNELLKNQTPPKGGDYTLRIPAGTKELVAANLDKLYPVATTTYLTHTVKKGETLTQICGLYNINKTTLLKANNLRAAGLKQGLRLRIPSTETKFVVLNKENQPNMSEVKGGAEKQVVLHQMKANDTLSKIAKQYQVPVQSIMQWNKISDQRKVKKGQQITLHLDRPAPEAMTILAGMPKAAVGMKQSAATKTVAEPQNAANIPLLADNKKQPSVASAATAKTSAAQAPMKSSVAQTPAAKAPVVAPQTAKAVAAAPRTAQTAVAKAPQASGANPPVNQTTKDAPTWYVVKTGDTLYNIAKRYQVSAQDLKKWNNLSSNALDIGNKLVVKKS